MEAARLDFYKASPGAIKALGGLEQHIAQAGFEKPLIELVRLRASQINGCAYCIAVHHGDALKAGEDVRRLATLQVWRDTPFFSDRERAALAWTEAVTEVADSHVPNEIWEQVRPHFTPQELTDLTLLIVTINAWNRFGIAFRKLPS